MEAGDGIEPTHRSFAGHGITTLLSGHQSYLYYYTLIFFSQVFFVKKMLTIKKWVIIIETDGDLAQLARATGLHPVGREFESLSLHHLFYKSLVFVTS